MANLGKKGDTFCVRFRLRGKEYKKSLRTKDESAARAALHLVELTLHRLHTGQLHPPALVDPGDFVVSGGTLLAPVGRPRAAEPPPPLPSTRGLIDLYTAAQNNLLAPSYLSSQAMHLRHLTRHLGRRADGPCDAITFRDLDGFVQARLAERHPNTAERERITLLQFYKGVVRQQNMTTSPAAGLSPIKGGEDRPPFRTAAEVERVLERGGLTDEERLDLWECLYLSPPEIAGLLATVRANAAADVERYLSDEAVEACPPTLGYRLKKAYRRNRAAVLVGSSFAMLVAVGVVAASLLAIRATNAERMAATDRDAAIEAEQTADREKINALASRDELRHALYASDLQMAASLWQTKDLGHTLEVLDRQRPQAGESDLRGFEWHFLNRESRTAARTLSLAEGFKRFTPDGRRVYVAERADQRKDGKSGSTLRSWDLQTGKELP